MNTFDLSQYELDETATLTVQNAREDGDLIGADGINPVRIKLYGSGSEQYARADHRANNAATNRMQAAFRGKAPKNQAEMAQQDLAQKLASCTAAIENFPVDPLALYSNNKLGYIRKQVAKFLEDDANFAKGSATN